MCICIYLQSSVHGGWRGGSGNNSFREYYTRFATTTKYIINMDYYISPGVLVAEGAIFSILVLGPAWKVPFVRCLHACAHV